MKTIVLKGLERESKILIGERIDRLERYLPVKDVIIITDINVKQHYHSLFPDVAVITIGSGEKIKTLDTVNQIYQQLLAHQADRCTFIVGIGGGIVCDIAGFVASTFLRGLRFGFVSSSLLAQVDASVGGKNGVNFHGYKNIVGVFNQPEFVICDFNLLQTLPPKEIRCGLAEIVKHAAIADADLFAYLESHHPKALQLETEVIEKLIHDSIVIKSSIVAEDERENAGRAKLNFGHTFGHAFEKLNIADHGAAVSAGMALASSFSVKKGVLSADEDSRIKGLLHDLKLPTRLKFDPKSVLDVIRKDKKRVGRRIKYVFLNRLGNAFVEEIPFRELDRLLDNLPSAELDS
jgi:3-dehydroquinate synthase